MKDIIMSLIITVRIKCRMIQILNLMKWWTTVTNIVPVLDQGVAGGAGMTISEVMEMKVFEEEKVELTISEVVGIEVGEKVSGVVIHQEVEEIVLGEEMYQVVEETVLEVAILQVEMLQVVEETVLEVAILQEVEEIASEVETHQEAEEIASEVAGLGVSFRQVEVIVSEEALEKKGKVEVIPWVIEDEGGFEVVEEEEMIRIGVWKETEMIPQKGTAGEVTWVMKVLVIMVLVIRGQMFTLWQGWGIKEEEVVGGEEIKGMVEEAVFKEEVEEGEDLEEETEVAGIIEGEAEVAREVGQGEGAEETGIDLHFVFWEFVFHKDIPKDLNTLYIRTYIASWSGA